MKYVEKVVRTLIETGARRATQIISETETIKATLQSRWNLRKNTRQRTILLTIGKPNYAERKMIKDCITAGYKFPLRKVQLKHYPERKAA